MAHPQSKIATQEQLALLNQAIEDGLSKPVLRMLNVLRPQDIAHLLESSPPKIRQAIWAMLDLEDEGEVLQFLSEDVQSYFLQQMDAQEVLAITEGLESDDVADILQQLPDAIIREVMASMDQQARERVEQVINYDEECAGGLMSTEMLTIRADITLDVVLRYLRRHSELPQSTDSLYVVSRRDSLIGILSLSKLLVSDPSSTVREVMQTNFSSVLVDTNSTDVALRFERNDWVSAPVVDHDGKLLGRITIDDAVDVLRDDLEHNMLSMAGLSHDEDTFASIKDTVPRRAIWLGINLLTALLASASIKLFEDTIEKVVALAVLMPIVASMGGVAGSQTLTVVIRGIALGQIGKNNIAWLLNREVISSLINGIAWALGLAIVAGILYQDFTLSCIIAFAMIINMISSALSGTILPLLLKKMNIDPALAGGVLLTTVTDVVGFVSFLGLATWFYG